MLGRVISPLEEVLEPRAGRRHIFVFDGLLDESLLRKRHPGARLVSKAWLYDHRWVVTREGQIAAIFHPDSVIYGVVWDVENVCRPLSKLDRHKSTETLDTVVCGTDGRLIAAEFRASNTSQYGAIDALDIVRILACAYQLRFPDNYMREISNWAAPPDRNPRHDLPRSTLC